jgi:hypothetical protein
MKTDTLQFSVEMIVNPEGVKRVALGGCCEESEIVKLLFTKVLC